MGGKGKGLGQGGSNHLFPPTADCRRGRFCG